MWFGGMGKMLRLDDVGSDNDVGGGDYDTTINDDVIGKVCVIRLSLVPKKVERHHVCINVHLFGPYLCICTHVRSVFLKVGFLLEYKKLDFYVHIVFP